MPTSTSATDAEPGQGARAVQPPQQPDRGGVQKVLGPLLVFVQARGLEGATLHVQVGIGQGVGVLEVHGADARGAAADDTAEQHDLLQNAVEHQTLEGQQGDLAKSAQQKVAQLCGVGDLEQLGGKHQSHPAALARQHGARHDERHPGVGQPGGAQTLAPHQLQRRIALPRRPVAEPDVGRVTGDPVPAAGLGGGEPGEQALGVDGSEPTGLGRLVGDQLDAPDLIAEPGQLAQDRAVAAGGLDDPWVPPRGPRRPGSGPPARGCSSRRGPCRPRPPPCPRTSWAQYHLRISRSPGSAGSRGPAGSAA